MPEIPIKSYGTFTSLRRGQTDRQTDRPTDQQTDRPTDRPATLAGQTNRNLARKVAELPTDRQTGDPGGVFFCNLARKVAELPIRAPAGEGSSASMGMHVTDIFFCEQMVFPFPLLSPSSFHRVTYSGHAALPSYALDVHRNSIIITPNIFFFFSW